MDSVEFYDDSSKKLDVGSIIAFSAGAAFLAGLALYLYYRNKDEAPIESDPPPVIIKSGSFVLESADRLSESGSGASGDPFIYTKGGFSLKWARIFSYNEISGDIRPFKYYENPTVQIWFKKITVPGATPDVVVRQAGNDFELTINTKKKLKFKTNSHSNRKNKYEDDEFPDTIVFNRVQINGDVFIANRGDQFIIGFYES